ncbi:hypothetical protein ASPZODRAFT_2111035 [Penicilliopsis zonata CBS 506.65]|uniref:Uncharacterized protein n=1 Tax=Penicilliopsis zonata CBS 506.65 TaxID=1073090 RepID=A0A1L9SD31_9EURO|nr:hypothetical protein ASPZODRAFT_2111035 [Penicilliopsis zonata CBS 506.65]OJJ45130.1 hypothetical protein ASPZODRAFT_2111035 [Penicilliopsis zonata CBS 506.65]
MILARLLDRTADSLADCALLGSEPERGEGSTDNATGLHDDLQDNETTTHGRDPSSLGYFYFRLGNSKYLLYNRFVVVDASLGKARGARIAPVGKADEARPDNEAWAMWKEGLLQRLAEKYNRPLNNDQLPRLVPCKSQTRDSSG